MPSEEHAPLGKSVIIGYDGDSKAYPILGIAKDPRIGGYTVPAVGTPHPDKARWPSHTFVKSVPIPESGDQRVQWVYQILPGPVLTGQALTPDGQLATVTTQDVAVGTAADSGALIESSTVEPVNTVVANKRTVTAPAIFDGKETSQQQAIQVPDKFLAADAIIETIDTTAAGATATPDTLGTGGTGIVQSSAQRIRVDRVRKSKKTLTGTINSTVVGYQKAPDGQLVTVTEAFNQSGAAPSIDATTEFASVDPIGGGNFQTRIGNVPAVFDEKSISQQQAIQVPDKFLAAGATIETTDTTAAGATATPDTLGTGGTGVIQSSAQRVRVDRVRKSKKTLTGTITPTVVGYQRSADGQLITVVETYGSGGTPGISGTTEIIDVNPVGGGKVISRIGTVPSILGLPTDTQQQPEQPPREFLNITSETTHEETIASSGNPTPEPLGSDGTGIVESSAQQIDAFKARKSKRTRIGNINFNLTEYERNDKGQLVTRAKSYGAGGAPSLTATTEAARVKAVGNGKFVKEIETVSKVFEDKTYTVSVPNPIPTKFRTTVPEKRESHIEEGTVEEPTLATGQFEVTKKQVTEQTRLIQTTAIPNGPFDSLTSRKIDPAAQGAISTTVEEITKESDTPTGGIFVLEASTEALSPDYSLKTIKTIDAWPVLKSTEYDERTGNLISTEKTFVEPSTQGQINGEQIIEIQAYDKWKSISIAARLDLATTSRNLKITYRYPFPNVLKNASFIESWAATCNDFGWDLGLHMDIKYGHAGPWDAVLHEVYTRTPESVSVPAPIKFSPEAHRVSLYWNHYNYWIDESGRCQGRAQAIVKTFEIPESLHASIHITGSRLSTGVFGTDTIPATTPVDWPTGETICVDVPTPERHRLGVWIVRWITLVCP